MNKNIEQVKESVEKSVFTDWRKYYLNWLAFGLIGGLLQPVLNDEGAFWTVKLWQALSGVPFGLICAVVFTFLQNKLNYQRFKYKTWGLAVAVWMAMKFVIAGIYLML